MTSVTSVHRQKGQHGHLELAGALRALAPRTLSRWHDLLCIVKRDDECAEPAGCQSADVRGSRCIVMCSCSIDTVKMHCTCIFEHVPSCSPSGLSMFTCFPDSTSASCHLISCLFKCVCMWGAEHPFLQHLRIALTPVLHSLPNVATDLGIIGTIEPLNGY